MNHKDSFVCILFPAVTLSCFASGYPTPRISWRRENNAILPTGGSIHRGNFLKIKSIKKEDRGTYYCIAENAVGKGARSKRLSIRHMFVM